MEGWYHLLGKVSNLKESYPVELAKYAVTQGINHQPAFCWWVAHNLQKRDQIITTFKKHYHKRTYKFGIEVPKTVKHALKINCENGNTLWQDAIAKEMEAVQVALTVLNDGEEPPPGHQYMDCHMVFDIKLDGFHHKARLVAGGHMMEAPTMAALYPATQYELH